MPVGGGGKPAGGYRAGKKGSYGCSGYPTVSADGTVHGCHKTKAQAQSQARAIWASVARKFVKSVEKAMVAEGDFVAFICHDEEMKIGRVEYVMTEGLFGLSGSEYAMEATPEDPVLSIRIFEEEDGAWEETEYTVGHRASEVVKVESIKVYQEMVVEMTATPNGMTETPVEEVEKAEKPNYDQMIKPRSGGSEPSNARLYSQILREAKDRFDVYPSAVANAWVVQEYKRRGGTYKGVDIETEKKDYSTETRRRMAQSGEAMPDGSFPIADRGDLMDAIRSVGRASNYAAAKEHIVRRARALNAVDMLPEDWKPGVRKTMWGGSIFDLNPFVE